MKSRSALVNKRQKWRSPSSASEEYAANPELQLKRFGERALETENNFLERELERLKQLALQRKSARAGSDAELELQQGSEGSGSGFGGERSGRRSRNISFSTGPRSEHGGSSSSTHPGGEVNKERSFSLPSARSKRFRSASEGSGGSSGSGGGSSGRRDSGGGNNVEGEFVLVVLSVAW